MDVSRRSDRFINVLLGLMRSKVFVDVLLHRFDVFKSVSRRSDRFDAFKSVCRRSLTYIGLMYSKVLVDGQIGFYAFKSVCRRRRSVRFDNFKSVRILLMAV